MRRSLWISLALVALVLVLSPTLAWAQDGNPPPVPVNGQGMPNMDEIDLTYVGEYVDCVYCVNIPGFGDTGMALTYDIYTDNFGNTWVAPSAFTALYTAITGYTPPGLPAGPADYYAGLGLASIVAQAGGLEALGITPEMASEMLGVISDNSDDLSDLSDGDLQIILSQLGDDLDFWVELNYNLLTNGEWFNTDFFVVSIYNGYGPLGLLSLPTPSAPGSTPAATATPRPTPTRKPSPTPRPTATPQLTPIACPSDSFSQSPPRAVVLEKRPPFPVVKGQSGQGLYVTARVTSYPVIHRWWTREERNTSECTWHGDYVTGQPDESVCGCVPDGGPGCWPGWGVDTTSEQYCQEHVEAIPDPIDAEGFQVHARLRPNSKYWIEHILAVRYPGSTVSRPDWDVNGAGEPWLRNDGVYILETETHFWFEDPGWYDMWMDGWTVGTEYTNPRSYRYDWEEPQPCYLMEVSLIPDWD